MIFYKKPTHFLALCFILCVFVIWTVLLVYKYFHFGYTNWDLAISSQIMWSLSFQGALHCSLLGTSNFISNHSNLIAFLLVPFFRIFPHPLTLIILKLFSLMVAGFVIYLIAYERLGRNIAWGILFLYFIYPANVYGMLYEFDFESLSPAVLALMFYFFIKDRWGMFMLMGSILVLIKENLPLIVFMFGVYGLFVKKDKIVWGLVPMMLGGGAFIFFFKVLIPLAGHYHSGYLPYNFLYMGWGESLPKMLKNIILNPKITWLYLSCSTSQHL